MEKSKPADPPREHPDYLNEEINGSDAIAVRMGRKLRRSHGLQILYQRQNNLILSAITPGNVARLLEIGCGIGNFLSSVQHRFPVVAGVDPGPESLALARKFSPRARLVTGSGEHLPFEPEAFDAIVMKGVVHHLKEPTAVFKEVRRCLKSGGTFLIYEGNRHSAYRRFMLGLANAMHIPHESTLFEHRSPEQMRRMLQEAGLQTSLQKDISGLFVPLALTGLGGRRLWLLLNRIEDLLQSLCPFLFDYHVLLVARKG
ncbi:MAG: class I SAM-dependent methyltransferase [bacterium]